MRIVICSLVVICLFSCADQATTTIKDVLANSPSIDGKADFLDTPYVTAGNRVYMVGHQNGTFPDLGWHIKGEMGGIWNHPIKLMDGFEAALIIENDTLQLNNATTFTNFPMANRLVYQFSEHNLTVEQWQFVPDDKQGVFIQYLIKNDENQDKAIDLIFTAHTDLRPTWLGEQTNMIDGKDLGTFSENKWIVKDENNPWFTVFGTTQNITGNGSTENINSNPSSNYLQSKIQVPATSETSIDYTIAGSYTSQEEALDEYQSIQNNYFSLAEDKRVRYAALANQSKLTIPDKNLEQAFEWLKYNCDWLVRKYQKLAQV